MKALIVGSGGREHALAWKVKENKRVKEIFIAPGNGGTAEIGRNVGIRADDLKGLVDFAKKEGIDLTVVGPENPLALGIVDLFEENELMIFGPRRKAAQIESSKVFAKRFMKEFGIPTAKFRVFSSYLKAREYLRESRFPKVVKADGLAGGKGVFVCKDLEEGLKALKLIMKEKEFGKAGSRVVIEECLFGEEASVICFTDGEKILPLLAAQDHKAIKDGDEGKNTGGMGAYAPCLMVDREKMREIVKKIFEPVIWGMRKRGSKYKGILYAGLMLTEKGPMVLEFNCRFGDPETQPQLMLLKSDLVDLMECCIRGKLEGKEIKWEKGFSVCVILASEGYPDSYEKGFEIKGLEKEFDGVIVFHAGTKLKGGKVVTNGGRVLGVTGRGESLKKAIEKTYEAVKKIDFKNKYYRKDIGRKAFKSG